MTDERYAVRCRECGQIIAVREGNRISSSMRLRKRKKEVRVRLESGQKMKILCDRCGEINELTGV